eukprot:TRINITY_DN32_c1_g1_i6.p2 TRINITY_DN32_c1_g1~~TRINITY_DN32_c1_g1_i6.p2  ORF type:complete len:218 (+),score=-6.90 TRINITY_DN32_c1_g1_i6:306-959(+)
MVISLKAKYLDVCSNPTASLRVKLSNIFLLVKRGGRLRRPPPIFKECAASVFQFLENFYSNGEDRCHDSLMKEQSCQQKLLKNLFIVVIISLQRYAKSLSSSEMNQTQKIFVKQQIIKLYYSRQYFKILIELKKKEWLYKCVCANSSFFMQLFSIFFQCNFFTKYQKLFVNLRPGNVPNLFQYLNGFNSEGTGKKIIAKLKVTQNNSFCKSCQPNMK